jgi:hypothetical protein
MKVRQRAASGWLKYSTSARPLLVAQVLASCESLYESSQLLW